MRRISAFSQTVDDDVVVKPFYPDDGDLDPEAVPGVAPETEMGSDAPSLTLEVDGEVFAVGPDKRGGTGYTWLSGPNPGYGFGVSPTQDLSLDEHRQNVRDFLAGIDPATGHLND
jgi:hypothetical protein